MTDGLTKGARWKRKLADWIACPSCARQWQRTNSQRQDGTRCCSARCTARVGNIGRVRRANRDAMVRYRQMIAHRLELERDQARDVEVRDIVRLMLDARREGIVVGRQQRGMRGRGRPRKEVVHDGEEAQEVLT